MKRINHFSLRYSLKAASFGKYSEPKHNNYRFPLFAKNLASGLITSDNLDSFWSSYELGRYQLAQPKDIIKITIEIYIQN